ncbi:hypothetical protein C8R44DRAFT_876779 [Mycena epipterygia]|nr:hypothetical protein C8R44DRAFT_876779 [Mycena epipterygia]
MMEVLLILSIVVTVIATFPTTLVYQSPTGFFLENIAVRPCSKLLLTSVLSPTLHTLDPTSANATLDEVYTFPNATALTGIVEYQPDVYAVAVSTLNITTRRADLGSVSIWRINFTSNIPVATRIAGILQSTIINGLSTVPGQVGSTGVSQAGAVEVLGSVQPSGVGNQYDDFAIDAEGRAWVTMHSGALTLLYPLANETWAQENAAGDPEGSYAVFTEPTSAAFGCGVNQKILYVTTGGGQVVSVDTSGK